MSSHKARESSYSLPDGHKVDYTDGETLKLATDFYQFLDHDYNGSPAIDATRVEQIIKNLMAGKPLETAEWDIMHDLQQRFGPELEAWRAKGRDGQSAAVPEGSGRIHESLAVLDPELRSAIMREQYATESTTKKDQDISTSHLLDSVLHDLAHTRQHVARMMDPDVRASMDSMQFNAEHALNHTESAQDHAKKLDDHLAQHASSPKAHDQERQQLNKMREAAPFPPPNLRISDDPTRCCGVCKMYYGGQCWSYNNLSVRRNWVCDSWAQDPTLTMQEAARRIETGDLVLERLREDSKSQVAVDFDGVIYDRANEPGGSDLAGDLVPGTKHGLEQLAKDFRIVIFTARPNIKAVRQWLEDHDLGPFIADVTNHKPSATAYVDNRSLLFKSWPQTVADLEKGDKSPYSSNIPGGKT